MVRRGHRLAVRPEAATEEEAEVEAPERERERVFWEDARLRRSQVSSYLIYSALR